mgnify:CR=1 FL=1
MEQNPDVTVQLLRHWLRHRHPGRHRRHCGPGDWPPRALKDEEKSNGAVENIVALDGVAVVVNPENGVTDLTVEQIAQIFTGEITNWSELGGADAERPGRGPSRLHGGVRAGHHRVFRPPLRARDW